MPVRLRTCLVALGLGSSPGVAHAAAPAARPAEEPARPTIVVTVHSDVDAVLDDALRAIQAHTQGGPTDLVIERSPIPGSDLRAQMRRAKTLAEQHAAAGVFWLDLESDDEFLLYLFEPEGLRVLVRKIPTSVEDQAAAIESLGVIVGSSSEAIAAGETIGMTPVDTEAVVVDPAKTESAAPEPPPVETSATVNAPPPKPPRAWKILRVSLAYTGSSYARAMPWQQGGSLALSAAVAPRLYLGLDYTMLAPDRVTTPVPLQLWRHPIAIHFGFHQMLVRWLALDAELAAGLTLDAWRRTDTDESGVRAIGTVAPWLYLRFAVWRGLSLDLGVGAEVPLNDFDYVWSCAGQMSTCPEDDVVVSPDPVRGRVRGGFSYSF